MTKYLFTIGKHTEQAHDYVSALIDEAYKRHTTPQERVSKAETLTEAHYAQVGVQPAESVLSRLAWYIVFDEMTDGNPHKVASEEYPILSEPQYSTRLKREKSLSDVYTGKNDETIGRYTDYEGVKRRVYDYMTPERDKSLLPSRYLDLYNAIENAGLTNRQREAIELVYFEGLTQEVAADVSGVSRATLRTNESRAFDKIRKYMNN